MLSNDTRSKIKDLTTGNVITWGENHCIAIRNILCTGFGPGRTDKKQFDSNQSIKKRQAKLIEDWCNEHGLWLSNLPVNEPPFAKGGEAIVFMDPDCRHVLKQNNAIYYSTWLEFFNSLLLHNLFFPNTAYSLAGFTKKEDSVFALLRQPFIIADTQVSPTEIKKHLEFNGFINTKRHDYIHKTFGVLLEDMHDENVLVNSETLFFIDTVFYILEPAI